MPDLKDKKMEESLLEGLDLKIEEINGFDDLSTPSVADWSVSCCSCCCSW